MARRVEVVGLRAALSTLNPRHKWRYQAESRLVSLQRQPRSSGEIGKIERINRTAKLIPIISIFRR